MWGVVPGEPRSLDVSVGRDRGAGAAASARGAHAGCGLWVERGADTLAECDASGVLSRNGARMSGYLQRLAASVARPRPSLHPLVGSIFSGERQEAAAAPTLTQNDASAFADEQNLVSTTRTVSDAPDGPMHRRDPAVDDRHRRGEPEILDPLLPRKTPEAGISAMLPETAREDVASAQSASVRLQHY